MARGNKTTRDYLIREEIALQKEISFRDFMELCLYHKEYGYYNSSILIGKQGDYYTSVSVSSVLFAKVLLNHFKKWYWELGSPEEWTLVEVGSGPGELLNSIYNELTSCSIPFPKIYSCDKSRVHSKMQDEKLPKNITFIQDLSELPSEIVGIIFSNELIDAMPVHRAISLDNKVYEIFVTLDNNYELKELNKPISLSLKSFIDNFNIKLIENQYLEVNLESRHYLQKAFNKLDKGYLLTIDYGFHMEEILARRNGTIRCFNNHMVDSNIYENLGQKDITSHVNFTTLENWGIELGFSEFELISQSNFFIDGGILDFLSYDNDPFSESSKRNRYIQQLIHPETMGEIFQVLIQKK